MSARILLAEDDRDQSEVLDEIFRSEGYEVEIAETADQVIAGLKRRPDLCLLDVNGVLTPEVQHALETNPHRPALLLVSADSRLAEVAARLHVSSYLAKPYELDDLLLRVKRSLESGLSPEPPSAAV